MAISCECTYFQKLMHLGTGKGDLPGLDGPSHITYTCMQEDSLRLLCPTTTTMMFFSFNTANCPTEVVGAVRLLQVGETSEI